jgi:cell division protease FtsH
MKQIFKTIAYGIISCVILLVLFSQLETTGTSSEITYTEFLEMTEHGDIEKVVIDGDILKIYPYDSTDYYETEYIEDTDFVNYLQEQEVEVTKETNSNSSIGFWSVVSAFLPFILILWLFSILFRRTSITETGSEPDNSGIGNIFNVGKNKSKLYKETDTGVKFADVAGQEEAKESLTEIIDYLHNADKYNTTNLIIFFVVL